MGRGKMSIGVDAAVGVEWVWCVTVWGRVEWSEVVWIGVVWCGMVGGSQRV